MIKQDIYAWWQSFYVQRPLDPHNGWRGVSLSLSHSLFQVSVTSNLIFSPLNLIFHLYLTICLTVKTADRFRLLLLCYSVTGLVETLLYAYISDGVNKNI